MANTVLPTGLATFNLDVIEASRQMPVVVDFWASWCGPCKSLAPILEAVAGALAGQASVRKVDTDAEQQLASQYQIRSIPTVILFRDGKPASQFVGVQPEKTILDWVRPFLAAAVAPATAPAGDSPESLAEQALTRGDSAAARQHLDAVPADRTDSDPVRALRTRLFFADELAAIGSGTADLDALYREGLTAATQGANARAIDAFLTLITRSRAYRDDAGRLALLRLFEALGPVDTLVEESRRKLSRVLH